MGHVCGGGFILRLGGMVDGSTKNVNFVFEPEESIRF